jgi:hypothetical protein
MLRTARRRGALGVAVAGLLLLSGCGGEEPEALKPMKPEVPADLCSLVPEASKAGLVANANTDTDGNPTAACSLRSDVDATSEVRAVVTWVNLNDDQTADTTYQSQCRAIDRTTFQDQSGFTAQGADEACAATGKLDGADSVTMAARAGKDVVTVRVSELPAGSTPALQRGQQMLEGVLSGMAG